LHSQGRLPQASATKKIREKAVPQALLVSSQYDEPPLHCLRCRSVRLRPIAPSAADSSFFECPSCQRQYTRKSTGAVTYRWRHPISLALYGVIFDREPIAHAPRIAQLLLRNRKPDEIAWFTEEIEHELKEPTQQVHLILDNAATEPKCRQFLTALVAAMRAAQPAR
jgi:transposase-like protein